jgi:hypothetical protein
VVDVSGKQSLIHFTAAFSISAIKDGVAKTGKLPEPMAIAVLELSTTISLCALFPNRVNIINFLFCKIKKYWCININILVKS